MTLILAKQIRAEKDGSLDRQQAEPPNFPGGILRSSPRSDRVRGRHARRPANWRSLAAAAALVAMVAAAQAQQVPSRKPPIPAVSQQPSPETGQRGVSREERGSEGAPVVVKVLPAEKTKDELDREHQKEDLDRRLVELTGDLAKYTKLLFAATAALALITAALVWFGFRQARDAKRSIAVAKRSAQIAERALTELERPFVYANVPDPGLAVVPSSSRKYGGGLNRGTLALSVYNFGRTPATLTRIEWKVTTAPKGSIPPRIDPASVGGRELPVGTVSASGDPFRETEKLGMAFIDEEDDIVAGNTCVWVLGFVRYDDVFGAHHITGFAQVFDTVGNRFVRRRGEGYNYARGEDPNDIPQPSPTA